jgi:Arc-like DNA binding domain.
MVSLTIRNIPEEIIKRIRILAAKNRRSMNSEMLLMIESGLALRISGDTSGYTHNVLASDTGASISSETRDRLWKDLCGNWKDNRTLQDIIEDTYAIRNGEIQA